MANCRDVGRVVMLVWPSISEVDGLCIQCRFHKVLEFFFVEIGVAPAMASHPLSMPLATCKVLVYTVVHTELMYYT